MPNENTDHRFPGAVRKQDSLVRGTRTRISDDLVRSVRFGDGISLRHFYSNRVMLRFQILNLFVVTISSFLMTGLKKWLEFEESFPNFRPFR